ncbi:CcdB family protein [Novosphingobium sp. TH158]|uniref:CcdB family protein n=1 Tax=Novosphingobium sp. TH158 TaxID=2067455 RepID=UPI000C7A74CE|nr:CcdB family protein [Novosphingobium sp. TH158]PLK24235.1 plasmid maintenance protein CcdB [Novosphingobium sp. TH158]
MARFDVCRMAGSGLLVVDCQADLLADLNTRVVAPLLPVHSAPKPARNLNPVLEVEGERHVMMTQQLSAVERRELGARVGSLAEHEREIVNALDFLLTGV